MVTNGPDEYRNGELLYYLNFLGQTPNRQKLYDSYKRFNVPKKLKPIKVQCKSCNNQFKVRHPNLDTSIIARCKCGNTWRFYK